MATMYWVKDDGKAYETDFYTTRQWAKQHPGKQIKLVEVLDKQVLIYSLFSDGKVFDFDGARISGKTLAYIIFKHRLL